MIAPTRPPPGVILARQAQVARWRRELAATGLVVRRQGERYTITCPCCDRVVVESGSLTDLWPALFRPPPGFGPTEVRLLRPPQVGGQADA